MGTLEINMTQISRWNVTSDNVSFFDSIQKSKGSFFTLDARPYVDLLNEFNIFYTLSV